MSHDYEALTEDEEMRKAAQEEWLWRLYEDGELARMELEERLNGRE